MFYVISKRILKVLLRFGCDPLIVNNNGKNALSVLMEKFGDDGWEFGMKDILMKAVDIMKIKRHKESKGEWNEYVAQVRARIWHIRYSCNLL